MKTVELNKHIDAFAKENGIDNYSIDGMKLTEGNFSINSDGKIEHDEILDVYIVPEKIIERITANIIITKNGCKEI